MTVKHLNYIGSKHSLLEWIHSSILEKTGYTSFQGKTIADLFAGTGVVSYHFRSEGATVLSNDIEPCSYAVTKAMTECSYTPQLQETISSLNQKLKEKAYESTAGFLTKHYSPYEGCERMYFTVDNAKRIDYIRKELQKFSEKDFLLASLLVSADAIANCASVYGAYLKKFKKTAEKEFYLQPIHTYTSSSTSKTVRKNVLDIGFLQSIKADIVYLDPPYKPISKTSNFTGYLGEFNNSDQERLAQKVKQWHEQGAKIMISNSYLPDYFESLYPDFKMIEVKAGRAVNSDPSKRGKVSELLMINY